MNRLGRVFIRSLGTVLLLLGLVGGASAGVFDAWNYRMKVSFSGYNRPETLTNFPVLLVLSNNVGGLGFAYSNCMSSTGGDLRFASWDEATALNYEIEQWNTNGASYVWVQAPTIATSNDFICAYWGCSTSAPAYTTNGATWTNGFKGVWHMNETNVLESTTNRYNGTAKGACTNIVPGMIGNANYYDGTSAYQTLGSVGLNVRSNYMFSAWIRCVDVSGSYREIFSKNSKTLGNGHFEFYADQTSGKLSAYIPDIWNGTAIQGTNTVNDNTWHHAAYTFDGLNHRLYLDGVFKTNVVKAGTIPDSTATMYLGAQVDSGPGLYFKGALDEIRIDGVTRSSNWVWACWFNQASNAAFVTYGMVGTSLTVRADAPSGLTTNGATLNGTVTANTGYQPNPAVHIVWDTADKGTNALTNWLHDESLGTNWGAGQSFSTNVTGLIRGSTYFYRCFVTNTAGGSAWSDAAQSVQLPNIPADSPYRARIGFTGYTRSETLTNFPVLILFGSNVPTFAYGQMSSTNGADLRFSDVNGIVEYPYEVEKWDTNGTSYVWVRVPAIVDTNSCLYAYCGLGSNAPSYCRDGSTWSNGFAGVWHLNTPTNPVDSTANGRHGVNNGAIGVVGLIGGAGSFTPNASIATTGKNIGISGSAARTLSCWAKISASPDPGGILGWGTTEGAYRLSYITPSTASNFKFCFWGYTADYSSGVDSRDSVWHQVTVTYDGSNIRIYVDGFLRNTSGVVVLATDDTPVFMGTPGSRASYITGTLDELSISTFARSSNWVWACWLNQASNSAFCSYGAMGSQTAPAVNNASGATNVTANSAWLNGALTATGGAPASVWVFWDTNNWTTNKSWAYGYAFNQQPVTALTHQATGLLSGLRYYYTFYASNTLGEMWAPLPPSFKTTGTPAVDNGGGATNITFNSATLCGTLTDGVSARVWVYWGTDPNNWAHTNDLGTLAEGAFSTNITGLTSYDVGGNGGELHDSLVAVAGAPGSGVVAESRCGGSHQRQRRGHELARPVRGGYSGDQQRGHLPCVHQQLGQRQPGPGLQQQRRWTGRPARRPQHRQRPAANPVPCCEDSHGAGRGQRGLWAGFRNDRRTL